MDLAGEFFYIGSITFQEEDINGNFTLEGEGDSRRLPLSARGEGQYQHYNRSWIVAISTKTTGKGMLVVCYIKRRC